MTFVKFKDNLDTSEIIDTPEISLECLINLDEFYLIKPDSLETTDGNIYLINGYCPDEDVIIIYANTNKGRRDQVFERLQKLISVEEI